jgi:sulfur-oxidizing protein SoxZ
MMSSRPRVRLPDSAKIGEVIEIKTLIAHAMETGNRRNADGSVIPRLLLHTFEARFAGREVFKASLHTGTAANPFISFFMRVPGPAEFEFVWIEDGGARITERQALKLV